MKKKFLAFSLTLVMVLGLFAGCTNGGEDNPSVVGEGGTSAGTDASDVKTDGLNIAIVTSPSGVDDGSFNQDNFIGAQNFVKNNPEASVTPTREPNSANSIPTAEGLVGDYDVIITPGFQFAGISEVAGNNPDKKFILVDTFPADPADPTAVAELPNIYAMTFAEEEGGFLAGVAAALETETGKVAVVNGVAFPTNVNYQFGFESGVAYANKHFDTKAEYVELPSYAGTAVTGEDVGGNYVGDFSDEARGKVVGEALLKEGVDVIFVAAGASGNGVFTAVKENGKAKVIGCDVDQYKDGENGSENIILTSVLKVMNLGVERALESVKDGTFKGENVVLRANTDSINFVSEEGHHQLTEETIEKLNEALEALKSGAVKPASSNGESTSEDFPGL